MEISNVVIGKLSCHLITCTLLNELMMSDENNLKESVIKGFFVLYLQIFNTQNTRKQYPFQTLSLEFILEIFLNFCKFQPRYSYKIKRVYGVLLSGLINFRN